MWPPLENIIYCIYVFASLLTTCLKSTGTLTYCDILSFWKVSGK